MPLALATWALVHASGVHATVAGVLLGLSVPVRPAGGGVPAVSTLAADTDVAHRFEHRLRPLSAGVAVPVFAFFASGVTVVGGGLAAAAADPVAIGVVTALVVGKLVGVFGATWLVARFTRASLDDGLAWADVAGLALLTGVGFTVSLLVGRAGLRHRQRRATTTSSSPSSSGRSRRRSWRPSSCGCATGSTRRSPSSRRATTTPTASPTSTSGSGTSEHPRTG